MNERWSKFSGWIKKEFASWLVKTLFGSALAGIIYVFATMSFGSFVLLLICMTVAVFTGTVLVKSVIRDLRKPTSRKREVARTEELARRTKIRKLFQQLMDEAESGGEWNDQQLANWLSRVEHSIRPLMEAEVKSFLELFGDWMSPFTAVRVSQAFIPVADKRDRCLCWMRAVLPKYWL